MGIRSKVLLAFLLCFGLVGWVSLVQLDIRMDSEFETLERADLVDSMGRVLKVMDASVSSLNSQTRDWAEWSEMYDYVQAPARHATWAGRNLNTQAIETADLSFVNVLDANGRVIRALHPATTAPHTQIPEDVRLALVRTLRAGTQSTQCGLLKTPEHPALACGVRITHSDHTGKFVGLVVMARLLDERRMSQLQEQTGFTLRLLGADDVPREAHWWRETLPEHRLGARDFALRKQPQVNVLYAPLYDLNRQWIATLETRMPRELFVRTQALQARVAVQAVVSALFIALLLAAAVHWLLIRRLRTFNTQLQDVAEAAAWGQRIVLPGRDELAALASEVNLMLEMIEAQVKELTALSLTDTLTGLANRRAFDMRLALEFGRARRHDHPLSLLAIDVDYFKRFNDRYGHPAGDAALQAVSDVLTKACGRTVDLAARMGGEEFSLLLPNTRMEGAVDVARRIGQLLADKAIAHAESSVGRYLTASIGVATLHSSDVSAHALWERADRALYVAKAQGRNRHQCDNPVAIAGKESHD